MQLETLVAPDLVFPDLPAFDVSTVLRAFADRVAATGRVADADSLYQALWEREQLGSTGIGHGVAIPHCKVEGISNVILAIGHVPKGLPFGAVDGLSVRLFFLVISPDSQPAAHLQCLSAISKWVQKSGRIDDLLAADSTETMLEILGQPGES